MISNSFKNYKFERNNKIVFTELDNEVCLFNPEKGEYLNLNQTGSRIWNLLDKPIQIEKIIEILLTEYDGDKKNIELNTEIFFKDGLQKEIFKIS